MVLEENSNSKCNETKINSFTCGFIVKVSFSVLPPLVFFFQVKHFHVTKDAEIWVKYTGLICASCDGGLYQEDGTFSIIRGKS